MASFTLDTGIAAIAGAVAGVVASLVAPWAKWGVEKRKKKLMWRKGFINDCKRIVNKSRFSPDMFRETYYYSNLKPHLSDKLQKDTEGKRYTHGKMLSREQKMEISKKEFAIKKRILDEINILERKWGLI